LDERQRPAAASASEQVEAQVLQESRMEIGLPAFREHEETDQSISLSPDLRSTSTLLVDDV
jgi:hypothetical protein